MQIHEVAEVVEASSVEDADDLLTAGWKLVTVVAGNRYVSGKHEIGPIYVLGKPAARIKHKINSAALDGPK